MTRNAELTPLLKRLKLSPMMDTLPQRIALARREQLDYSSFLEIILTDEVSRRENRRIELRLKAAGFEETCRLEDFDSLCLHHPGPQAAGCRVLPRVPAQARTRAAGGSRGCGQELHCSIPRIRRHHGRIYRPFPPR